MIRLAVRLDAVAALRRGEGGKTPDLHAAAHAAMLGGADALRLRLTAEREAADLRQGLDAELHLDVAAAENEVAAAARLQPARATLVPPTVPSVGATSQGLPPGSDREGWKRAVETLRTAGVPTAVRLMPDEQALLAASEAGTEWVDLDTSVYARARTDGQRLREFLALRKAASTARQLGLRVTLGGHLRPPALGRLALLPEVEEVHLGFEVLARALFQGLTGAVKDLKLELHQARAARAAGLDD